ncbi:MAG: hypothetical protein J2P21_13260 [Chloracidobacterium sp.]|nr:hypothetical protein [Chloracidobacterium sp.]
MAKKEPAIVSNDGPVKLKGKEREKSQKEVRLKVTIRPFASSSAIISF